MKNDSNINFFAKKVTCYSKTVTQPFWCKFEIRIFREGNATSISSHHLHEKSDFFQCTVNIATVNRWVKLFRANIITSQAMPLLNKHRKCTQIKEIIYQKRRSPNVNWIGWYNHSNYGLKPPVKITKGNQF